MNQQRGRSTPSRTWLQGKEMQQGIWAEARRPADGSFRGTVEIEDGITHTVQEEQGLAGGAGEAGAVRAKQGRCEENTSSSGRSRATVAHPALSLSLRGRLSLLPSRRTCSFLPRGPSLRPSGTARAASPRAWSAICEVNCPAREAHSMEDREQLWSSASDQKPPPRVAACCICRKRLGRQEARVKIHGGRRTSHSCCAMEAGALARPFLCRCISS